MTEPGDRPDPQTPQAPPVVAAPPAASAHPFNATLSGAWAWSRARLDLSPARHAMQGTVWLAAGLVGVAAVAYAKLIAAIQALYFLAFARYPIPVACAGPVFFVLAVWTVKRFGPDARGSGIPQVLVAIERANHQPVTEASWKDSLVSARTAAVKVLSSALGILGGASIGREGPTVQVAAAGFAWIGKSMRRFTPDIEFRTFLTAGAAAGVAAAFNTPIAGITFA